MYYKQFRSSDLIVCNRRDTIQSVTILLAIQKERLQSQIYQNFGTIIQMLTSNSEGLWPCCAAWRRTLALKLQSNSANKN